MYTDVINSYIELPINEYMKDVIIAVLRNIGPKKNQASTGFEPRTLALPLRCSTNRAMKPSTLGAGGQFVGFIRP